jgi:hypothetical protein
VRVHTDYLYDPPPYTRYQTFVRRLRQEEDEAGPQYVLQPVPEAHRDASVRPPERPPQQTVTVDPMYYDHDVPVPQKQVAILMHEHIKEHGGSSLSPLYILELSYSL